MKKYIGMGLLMMINCVSFAQIQRTVVKQITDSTTTVREPANNRESKKGILKDLELTKEQKIKMKEINQSMKTYKETIEKDATLSDKEKKEKLKTLRIEQLTKIQAILTEEQKIKFREARRIEGKNG